MPRSGLTCTLYYNTKMARLQRENHYIKSWSRAREPGRSRYAQKFYGAVPDKLRELERHYLYPCKCRNPISLFLAKGGCKIVELKVSHTVISSWHFALLPVPETIADPRCLRLQ